MVQLPIYLDNHATTRCDPRVVEVMLPFFTERYGNPSSRQHCFGWEAKDAVDSAREQVAHLLGAQGREIVFTSGATESNNLALHGIAAMYRSKGDHIITAATEHRAILDPCKRLEQDGLHVTVLPVDRFGRVSVQQVAGTLTDRTILVTIMAANNEIGTLQPIREIGRLCKEREVLFHTDAVQAVGKILLDVEEMGIDLLSLSAHKIYGPKGSGALYVRSQHPRVRLRPLLDGGGQERGLRAGTLAVPAIVGLGKAAELALQEMAVESERLRRLRDELQQDIQSGLDDVFLNGDPIERLPGNLNLSFAYVEGNALLMNLKDVAVSSGSACTSADPEPSHVLRAIGCSDELTRSSIRFGLGRFTTKEEIAYVSDKIVHLVKNLRTLSPAYALATRQG